MLEIPQIIERISDALKVGIGIASRWPFNVILECMGECDKEITERSENHHRHQNADETVFHGGLIPVEH